MKALWMALLIMVSGVALWRCWNQPWVYVCACGW